MSPYHVQQQQSFWTTTPKCLGLHCQGQGRQASDWVQLHRINSHTHQTLKGLSTHIIVKHYLSFTVHVSMSNLCYIACVFRWMIFAFTLCAMILILPFMSSLHLVLTSSSVCQHILYLAHVSTPHFPWSFGFTFCVWQDRSKVLSSMYDGMLFTLSELFYLVKCYKSEFKQSSF